MDEKTTQTVHSQLAPNVRAALAYAIPLVMGVVTLATEKDDKTVKFHAFQSIIFGLVWYGAWAISVSLNILLIGYLLTPLVTLTGVILWFLLMWKAYNKEEYELPIIGKIACEQANK